jgi:hypothetical protein
MKEVHPVHVEQLLKQNRVTTEDLINPWLANIVERTYADV